MPGSRAAVIPRKTFHTSHSIAANPQRYVSRMRAHRFLSPEWIEAAMAVRAELASSAPASRQTARVNLVVTEVPFGDGEFLAYVDTQAGGPLPVTGNLEEPDATVFLDYPAALAAFVTDDPDVVAHGFLSGALRVEGDLALVLILFGEGMTEAQAEFARHAQERLRSITICE